MFSRGFSGLLLISWYLCCSLSSYLVEEKTGMLGSPEPVLWTSWPTSGSSDVTPWASARYQVDTTEIPSPGLPHFEGSIDPPSCLLGFLPGTQDDQAMEKLQPVWSILVWSIVPVSGCHTPSWGYFLVGGEVVVTVAFYNSLSLLGWVAGQLPSCQTLQHRHRWHGWLPQGDCPGSLSPKML